MTKYFYLALVCFASMTLFTACNGNGKNNPDNQSLEGQWITNPDQYKNYNANDSINDCWQFDLWCDGTTIGRQYLWTTEAAILFMIQEGQAAEMRVYGYYAKKYKYEKVEEPTEAACESRVWEGARCWLITYYFKHKDTGEMVTEQEYFWAPEQNAKERADYYKSHAAETGMIDYKYEPADFDDQDACIAQNPNDTTTIVVPGEKSCWKITVTINNVASETFYMWMTKAQLDDYIEGISLSGQGTASAEPATADDEDSCLALNAQN